MSDYSELKRLAQACGTQGWRFLDYKLTEYGIRDDGGYIAFLPVGHPSKYGACPEREAKARFLGAMTPATVLSLIAELERVVDLNHKQFGDAIRKNSEVEALRKECARLAEDNQALLEHPEDSL